MTATPKIVRRKVNLQDLIRSHYSFSNNASLLVWKNKSFKKGDCHFFPFGHEVLITVTRQEASQMLKATRKA